MSDPQDELDELSLDFDDEEFVWNEDEHRVPVGNVPESSKPIYVDEKSGTCFTVDLLGRKQEYKGKVETNVTFPDGAKKKGSFWAGPPPKCICEMEELMVHGCQCGGK